MTAGREATWRCEQHPDLTPGERFPSDGGGPYCLACSSGRKATGPCLPSLGEACGNCHRCTDPTGREQACRLCGLTREQHDPDERVACPSPPAREATPDVSATARKHTRQDVDTPCQERVT